MSNPPRLFHNGNKTLIANALLQLDGSISGIVPPFLPKTRFSQRPFMAFEYLETRGWAERRRSGPRGGQRFHATDLGRAIASACRQPEPERTAVLALLGVR